jgi:putative DNA primase/helicase
VDARAITLELGGKWQRQGFGLCRCPVHADRTPSLKVTDDPRKSDGVDVHCFAGCDWRDVKNELLRQGLLASFKNEPHIWPHRSPRCELPEKSDGLARAANIWRSAIPLSGTPGERYLTEIRGLDVGKLDLAHALRWHFWIGISNERCRSVGSLDASATSPTQI